MQKGEMNWQKMHIGFIFQGADVTINKYYCFYKKM